MGRVTLESGDREKRSRGNQSFLLRKEAVGFERERKV